MRISDPYAPYRLERVDHPVWVRLIQPDSGQHVDLSRALSALEREEGRIEGGRYCAMLVAMLNVVEGSIPNAADMFTASAAGCRRVIDKYLSLTSVHRKASRDHDGSVWLTPRPVDHNRLSETLLAFGKVALLLKEVSYGGVDPSKISPRLTRTGGNRSKLTRGWKNQAVMDTDRYYRLKRNPASAPRYDDPRCFELLAEGLRRIGAPPVFRIMCGLAFSAGPRASQCLALNMGDVLVRPKEVGEITAPNKGSRGRRRVVLVPSPEEYEGILDWINGPLARLTKIDLKTWRQLAGAKNDSALKALNAQPLFTENGVDRIKYARLWEVIRAAAVEMDLYFDDDRYRETGKKRFLSFHLLRHEYVHRRMDGISLLPADERGAAKDALKAYMKWSDGDEMLAWYSAHHEQKVGLSAARDHHRPYVAPVTLPPPTEHDVREEEAKAREAAELAAMFA